jgi:ribonuclease BN (tRNA processing enzyme)
MDIRILGAHNSESADTSCVTFIIDDTLAVEAGGLTSRLSIAEQRKIDAVLLTHHHLDHIRDIPALALNFYRFGTTLDIYATARVSDIIKDHLLNSEMYPAFQNIPGDKPTLSFQEIEPYGLQWIDGHSIMPVPVHHIRESVGYMISDKQGNSVFYTGDTGPELTECWRHVSPQLIISEVTLDNQSEVFARQTGHLTPGLLQQELINFKEINGYLPAILAVHMDAALEPVIRKELADVAAFLHVPITLAQENMRFCVN